MENFQTLARIATHTEMLAEALRTDNHEQARSCVGSLLKKGARRQSYEAARAALEAERFLLEADGAMNLDELVDHVEDLGSTVRRQASLAQVRHVLATTKRAHVAATAFYRWLLTQSEEQGQEAKREVWIKSPQDCPRQWGGWHVSWESGPFEWAVALSGGGSILAGEFGYGLEGEFPDGISGPWGFAEPGYSFSLVFHQERARSTRPVSR